MTLKNAIYRLLLISLIPVLQACQLDTTAAEQAEEAKPELIRPALVFTPIRMSGGAERTFPAVLEATDQTNIAFRVAGQLTKLPVQPGQTIKQGQLIAQLDDTDFRTTLSDYQAKLDLAATQYQQTYGLFQKNYIAKSQLDSARATLRSAEAAVKQGKSNLTYTTLRAPFSGVVAHVSVENFQFIQPQQTIIQLQRAGDLGIRFDVPESVFTQMRQVKNYQTLCGSVSFNASPDTYKACYKEHDLVPDTLTRSYPVLFSLTVPNNVTLLAGMSANITIDLSAISANMDDRSVLIPVEAVFDQNNSQYVWRVEQDLTLHKQPVKVGGISNNMIRITEGLSTQDRIVAAGVSYLVEGQQIRIYEKERGL